MILELSSSLSWIPQHRLRMPIFAVVAIFLAWFGSIDTHDSLFASDITDPYVRPLDVALSENGHWLVSANASGTLALIDCNLGIQVDDLSIGAKPTAITCTHD